MNAHDPKLEQRLAELRGVAEPMPADKRRVLEAVRAALDLAPGSPLPAAADVPAVEPALGSGRARVEPSAKAAARSLRPWFGGALIGGVVGLALGFGLGRAGHGPTELAELDRSRVAEAVSTGSDRASSPPDASAPVAQVPAAGSVARTARDGSGAPQPGNADELARRRPARKASRALSNAPPSPAEPQPRNTSLDLALALELLQRAEQALHASEPQLALGLLGDLDRRSARPLLREERLTTLTLVLCQLDRSDDARATRQELQREFPSSIYARRLAQSCAMGEQLATPALQEPSLPKIAPGTAK